MIFIHFQTILRLQAHATGEPSDLSVSVNKGYQTKRSTLREVKINPHEFCHIKYPCNSYIFKFYPKHLFVCGIKYIGFILAKNLSVKQNNVCQNILHFKICLKKTQKTTAGRKVWKYLATITYRNREFY